MTLRSLNAFIYSVNSVFALLGMDESHREIINNIIEHMITNHFAAQFNLMLSND